MEGKNYTCKGATWFAGNNLIVLLWALAKRSLTFVAVIMPCFFVRFMSSRPIRAALLSVYHKDRLAPLVQVLRQHGVKLYSTGGTQQFLEDEGAEVTAVEDLTGFPEVFGGRVKTLHPKVFGGILHRRHDEGDLAQAEQYGIPPIDLVVVDLYPFEETVASGAPEGDVIEKIDIGGISLLRAAAKNYRDVLVISSRDQYAAVTELLTAKNGTSDLEDRRLSFCIRGINVRQSRAAHHESQYRSHRLLPEY